VHELLPINHAVQRMADPNPVVFVVNDDVSARESLEVLIGGAGRQPQVSVRIDLHSACKSAAVRVRAGPRTGTAATVTSISVSATADRPPSGFGDPEVRRTARAKALSALQGLDRRTGGSPAESWIGHLS
jgi:hypothetical protein